MRQTGMRFLSRHLLLKFRKQCDCLARLTHNHFLRNGVHDR